MKLGKVIEAKNIYDKQGNITATRIKTDNSQSLEYLHKHEPEILKHYEIIKSYTKEPNELYYDAIFILAFFNELLEFSAGKPIEDRCIYVKKIPLDKDIVLASWITDDLIGSLFYNGHLELEKKWHNLDYNEKYLYILHYLDSPTQKGRKCIHLPDRQKYTRFPPEN